MGDTVFQKSRQQPLGTISRVQCAGIILDSLTQKKNYECGDARFQPTLTASAAAEQRACNQRTTAHTTVEKGGSTDRQGQAKRRRHPSKGQADLLRG